MWTNIAIPQSEMRPSSHCFFLLLSGFWVTPCYANMALTGQRRSHCFCQTKNRWRVGHCCLLKMSEPVVRHTAHLNTSFSVMCILTSLFVQTDQSHKRYPLVLSILPIVREKVCDFFGVILYNFHVCSLTWPVKDIDAEGCSVRCSEASIKYLFTKLHL